jgi:GDP-4-dehydro-6-deoxy-D-mannose reductase
MAIERRPVLVTGAAGFVGAHLIARLQRDDVPVTGWYRPDAPPRDRLSIEWQAVDLLDPHAVGAALGALQPTAIYHLAGSAHVADSWRHTRETFAGNVLATQHLLRALRLLGQAPRVLVTGSATVYAPSATPLTEQSPLGPSSPYGTSKLAQERLAAQAFAEWQLPTLLVRAFNHIGPGQTPAYVASSIARQIALIERQALPPVLRLGNLDPLRDLMDVRDTVEAYVHIMRGATPGQPYNVCRGDVIRIGHLVDLFLARARVAVTIEQDPSMMRPSDVPIQCGSHARLTRETGWLPRIPVEQTVDDVLAWWRQQDDLH